MDKIKYSICLLLVMVPINLTLSLVPEKYQGSIKQEQSIGELDPIYIHMYKIGDFVS